MKHLKTFEKYSYGEYDLTEEGLKDFARKAVVGGAVAASLIGGTPKTSYGQTKEPVKTEQSAKQSTMFSLSTATQEEKDLIIKVQDLEQFQISQKDFDGIVKQLQELSKKYNIVISGDITNEIIEMENSFIQCISRFELNKIEIIFKAVIVSRYVSFFTLYKY